MKEKQLKKMMEEETQKCKHDLSAQDPWQDPLHPNVSTTKAPKRVMMDIQQEATVLNPQLEIAAEGAQGVKKLRKEGKDMGNRGVANPKAVAKTGKATQEATMTL